MIKSPFLFRSLAAFVLAACLGLAGCSGDDTSNPVSPADSGTPAKDGGGSDATVDSSTKDSGGDVALDSPGEASGDDSGDAAGDAGDAGSQDGGGDAEDASDADLDAAADG